MPVRLNPKSKREGIYLDTGPWESAVLELKEVVKRGYWLLIALD
jgi:hypothetical protein